MLQKDKLNSSDQLQIHNLLPPSFWQRYQVPILLTIVGGAIDTIGFITLFGFFIAHVTGNTTQLGIGLSDYIANRSTDNAKKLGHSAALVISFVFVIPVLYLWLLARNSEFLQHIS